MITMVIERSPCTVHIFIPTILSWRLPFPGGRIFLPLPAKGAASTGKNRDFRPGLYRTRKRFPAARHLRRREPLFRSLLCLISAMRLSLSAMNSLSLSSKVMVDGSRGA